VAQKNKHVLSVTLFTLSKRFGGNRLTEICHLKSQHLLESKFHFHYLGQSPYQTRAAQTPFSFSFPKRNTRDNAYTVAASSQWRTYEFVSEGVYAKNFFQGGFDNLDEDRGQRERGFGDGSRLVRGPTQFENE
jgi:hypothetical protein